MGEVESGVAAVESGTAVAEVCDFECGGGAGAVAGMGMLADD